MENSSSSAILYVLYGESLSECDNDIDDGEAVTYHSGSNRFFYSTHQSSGSF